MIAVDSVCGPKNFTDCTVVLLVLTSHLSHDLTTESRVSCICLERILVVTRNNKPPMANLRRQRQLAKSESAVLLVHQVKYLSPVSVVDHCPQWLAGHYFLSLNFKVFGSVVALHIKRKRSSRVVLQI